MSKTYKHSGWHKKHPMHSGSKYTHDLEPINLRADSIRTSVSGTKEIEESEQE